MSETYISGSSYTVGISLTQSFELKSWARLVHQVDFYAIYGMYVCVCVCSACSRAQWDGCRACDARLYLRARLRHGVWLKLRCWFAREDNFFLSLLHPVVETTKKPERLFMPFHFIHLITVPPSWRYRVRWQTIWAIPQRQYCATGLSFQPQMNEVKSPWMALYAI